MSIKNEKTLQKIKAVALIVITIILIVLLPVFIVVQVFQRMPIESGQLRLLVIFLLIFPIVSASGLLTFEKFNEKHWMLLTNFCTTIAAIIFGVSILTWGTK